MKNPDGQGGKKGKKKRPVRALLSFDDCIDRTGVNACFTIRTIFSDFIYVTGFNDCIHRATVYTATTGDAFFCDIQHLGSPLVS